MTAGMGSAFLPDFAVLAELRAGMVVTLGLTETLLSEAMAHLVVRARRRLPDVVATLLGFFEEHLVALTDKQP